MRRTLTWNALALLLRLAVAWYVAQVLVTALLGTMAAGLAGIFAPSGSTPLDQRVTMTAMAGVWAGFMGGILLFPYSAALLALVGTGLQVRALSGEPLSAFHQIRLQVPWTAAEAREAMGPLLHSLGATSLEAQGDALHARFTPPSWARRWQRWAQTDEATIRFLPEAMDVQVRPASRLLYAVLWVDRGRSARRMEALQALVSGRLAAERRTEREAHRAEAQAARLAQAELLLLRAQVEPHFLFNTLAHLRELVRTGDTPAALAMVDALVVYARAATQRISQVNHPLGEEAATIEGYLALMALRFGHRLSYTVEVPSDLHAIEVPVGTLLIPVESAVKHGVEPKRGGGTITVSGSREPGRLVVAANEVVQPCDRGLTT